MKFTTATLFALAATVASATAVEKRIDVPGLKCSGEDALSELDYEGYICSG